MCSDAVVRFPCGLGVTVYHGHGGLCSILPLGLPRLLPRFHERSGSGKIVAAPRPPELGDEYFARPNMRPADGLRAEYGKGGDLRWLSEYKAGKLDGLVLRFELEGFLCVSECGRYHQGRLVEKWQD